MKSSTRRDTSKRTYNSRLREQQKESTRELIIRAAGDSIAEGGQYDLTMQKLAARAGLSLQTIYKHFPSREALLEGMCDWLYSKNRDAISSAMKSLTDNVPAAVQTVFTLCDADAAVTSASTIVSLSRKIRPNARRSVDAACRQGLAKCTSSLDPNEVRKAYAAIRYLISADAWLILKQQMGLTTEEAIDSVSRAIQLLLADLNSRNSEKAVRGSMPSKEGRRRRQRKSSL